MHAMLILDSRNQETYNSGWFEDLEPFFLYKGRDDSSQKKGRDDCKSEPKPLK